MSDGKLRALIEALRPFAAIAVEVDAFRHEDESTCLWRLRAKDIRHARDVLTAAAPHLSASSNEGWRDIASAPTNKAILILVPNLDYYGNQGVYAGMLVDMGTGPRWMTFGWAIGRDLGSENKPTHWRPLPPPPSPGEEHTPQSMEQGR